jgi:hypothetical protein
MSMYFQGYAEAHEQVQRMSRDELLRHIDSLYGRDNLPDDFTDDDLRHEALAQTRRDFTDTTSSEYRSAQFFIGLHQRSRA